MWSNFVFCSTITSSGNNKFVANKIKNPFHDFFQADWQRPLGCIGEGGEYKLQQNSTKNSLFSTTLQDALVGLGQRRSKMAWHHGMTWHGHGQIGHPDEYGDGKTDEAHSDKILSSDKWVVVAKFFSEKKTLKSTKLFFSITCFSSSSSSFQANQNWHY